MPLTSLPTACPTVVLRRAEEARDVRGCCAVGQEPVGPIEQVPAVVVAEEQRTVVTPPSKTVCVPVRDMPANAALYTSRSRPWTPTGFARAAGDARAAGASCAGAVVPLQGYRCPDSTKAARNHPKCATATAATQPAAASQSSIPDWSAGLGAGGSRNGACADSVISTSLTCPLRRKSRDETFRLQYNLAHVSSRRDVPSTVVSRVASVPPPRVLPARHPRRRARPTAGGRLRGDDHRAHRRQGRGGEADDLPMVAVQGGGGLRGAA